MLYGLGFRTIGAAWTVLLAAAVMLFTGLMCARYLRRAVAT